MFLPGESQGWGSLVGCRLWGRTDSDTSEATYQQQRSILGFSGSSAGEESTCNAGDLVPFLGQEDALEKG